MDADTISRILFKVVFGLLIGIGFSIVAIGFPMLSLRGDVGLAVAMLMALIYVLALATFMLMYMLVSKAKESS